MSNKAGGGGDAAPLMPISSQTSLEIPRTRVQRSSPEFCLLLPTWLCASFIRALEFICSITGERITPWPQQEGRLKHQQQEQPRDTPTALSYGPHSTKEQAWQDY